MKKTTLKRKTKKRGKTIEELQASLLITPEKLYKSIDRGEVVKDEIKRDIVLHGDSERERIENMTNDEMSDVLLGIKDSIVWIAYKKYILSRMKIVETSLFTLDPYKQTTETARNQGIRMGLMDFEGYLLSLEEVRKKGLEE